MSRAGSVHVHSSASSHGRILTENPALLDLLREKSLDSNKRDVSDSHTGHRFVIECDNNRLNNCVNHADITHNPASTNSVSTHDSASVNVVQLSSPKNSAGVVNDVNSVVSSASKTNRDLSQLDNNVELPTALSPVLDGNRLLDNKSDIVEEKGENKSFDDLDLPNKHLSDIDLHDNQLTDRDSPDRKRLIDVDLHDEQLTIPHLAFSDNSTLHAESREKFPSSHHLVHDVDLQNNNFHHIFTESVHGSNHSANISTPHISDHRQRVHKDKQGNLSGVSVDSLSIQDSLDVTQSGKQTYRVPSPVSESIPHIASSPSDIFRHPEGEERTAPARGESHYSQKSDTSYSRQQLKNQERNQTDSAYSRKQLKRQESNQSAKQNYPEPVQGSQSPRTGRRGGTEEETPRHSSSSVYAVANPEILAAQGITPTTGQQNVKFTPWTERSVKTNDSARSGNVTPLKETSRDSVREPRDSLEEPRDSLEEPRDSLDEQRDSLDKSKNFNDNAPRDSLESPARISRESHKTSRQSAVSFKRNKEYIDKSDQDQDDINSQSDREADKHIQERVPTPHPSSPRRGSKISAGRSTHRQEWDDDPRSEDQTPVNSDNDTPQPPPRGINDRPPSTPEDNRKHQSPPTSVQENYKSPSVRDSYKHNPPSVGSRHSRESRKQRTPSTPVPVSRGRRPLSSPVADDRKSVGTGNSLPTVKRVYVDSPTFTREEEDEFRTVASRLEENKDEAVENRIQELEKIDRKRSKMADNYREKPRFTRAEGIDYDRENRVPNYRGRDDDNHNRQRYDDQAHRESQYDRQPPPRDRRYEDRNQHGRYDNRERYEDKNEREGRYEDRNEYGRYEDRNERDRYERKEPERYERHDDRNQFDDRRDRDSLKRREPDQYGDRRDRYDNRRDTDRYEDRRHNDDRGRYVDDQMDRNGRDERDAYYDDRQRHDDRRQYDDYRERYNDERGRYNDDRGRFNDERGRYTEERGRYNDDDRGRYDDDRGRYDDSRNTGDRYDERNEYDRYNDGNDRMDDYDYRGSRPNLYQNGYSADDDDDKHLMRQERDYQDNLRLRLENEAKKDDEILIPKLPLDENVEDPWNNLPPPPPQQQQNPFAYDEDETARMEVVNPPPVKYDYVENNKVDYGKIPSKSYSFLQERKKEEEEKLEHVFVSPKLPPKARNKRGGRRASDDDRPTPQDDYPQSENASMAEALWAKRSAVLSKKKDSRSSTGMKSKTASGTSLKKNRGLQKYPSEPGLPRQQYRSYAAPQMYGTPTRNNYLEPMENKPNVPLPMQSQNPALHPNSFKRPLDLKPVTQEIMTEDGQRISVDINLKLISPPPGAGQKLSPRQIQADVVPGPQMAQGGPRPVGSQYNYQDYGQNYGQTTQDQYNNYYQSQLPPPEQYHFDYGQKENQPPPPQQAYDHQMSPRLAQVQTHPMETEQLPQKHYTAHHNQQPQPQEYVTSPTNPYPKVPPIVPSFIDDPGPIRADTEGYAAMHRKLKDKEKEEQWYQTYTLRDFKILQKEMAAASRGPSLGPDLENLTYKEKLEKRNKQFEYARLVMEKNRQELMEKRHAPRRVEKQGPSEEYQRRKAAIEYAKHVPKPVIKSRPTQYNSYEVSSQLSPIAKTGRGSPGKPTQQVEVINLQKLQQRHEEEKKNVNTIKQNIGTVPQKA